MGAGNFRPKKAQIVQVCQRRLVLVYEDDEKFLPTLPSDLESGVRDYLSARPISMEDHLSVTAELIDKKQSARTRVFISPHNVHWCSIEMGLALR